MILRWVSGEGWFGYPLYAPEGEGGGGEGAGENPEGPQGDGEQGQVQTFDWAGYRNTLTDDKLRATAERFDTPDKLIESVNTLRQDLSTRIRLPGKDATDEDMAKFRKAFGVPESEKGYEIKPPEGVTLDESDQAFIDQIKPIAFKHNIPASAFTDFVIAASQQGNELRSALEKEITSARESASEELKKDWGTDFDKNVNLAKRATSTHGGDRFTAFLNGAKIEGGGLLGDHPEMVRFLASVGRKTDESELVLQSSEAEKTTAKDELDKIYSETPPGSPGYLQPAVQKRVAELNRMIHGSAPIVGGEGRTS